MAIINCKECGSEVSSKAKNCPNCGCKVSSGIGCGTAIGIVLLAFVAIGVILNMEKYLNEPSKSKSDNVNAYAQNTASTPNPPATTNPPDNQWTYKQGADPMQKGLIYQAQILSTNTVNFDFPYSGPQHGVLTLRTHPRHGKEIIFNIERGQFLCSSYNGCTVLIRFDDEEPVKYSASTTADRSSETIFIGNYSRFVGKMLKSKRIRISADIYKENAPIFEFDVSQFDVNKYKPAS